jgi:AmmeMemoRadiSam system protein A
MKLPWPINLFKTDPPNPTREASEGACLARLARQTVEDRLRDLHREAPAVTGGYLARRSGVFVTIRTKQGQLRGCRGTIHPGHRNLVEETRAVALSSAFEDERFDPVQLGELENLTFEVSVLHPAEPVEGLAQLDPAIYGIIVRATDGRQALMLPGVEGLEQAEQQFEATLRKAYIYPGETVQIQRFRVDKFKEET